MLVQARGASGTRVFPSAFPPARTRQEARGCGDVPHPSPLWGMAAPPGSQDAGRGAVPKMLPAAGRFPCAVRDQPPPRHTRLVLSSFGRPRGGAWAKGPSPRPRFTALGLGGRQWPARVEGSAACRQPLCLARGCPDAAGIRGPEPPRDACSTPVPMETSASLGEGALASPPWAPACHCPREAQLITPRTGALVPAARRR